VTRQRGSARFVPAFCLAFCALSAISPLRGRAQQTRFEVNSRENVAAVPGLSIYSIRDNQLGACFMLFILEPPEAGRFEQPTQPWRSELTAEQAEKVRVAHVLEEAAAARDREVEALRKRANSLWTIQYEYEFAHIQDEYEQAVRSVLPDLYPSAQVAPGLRTSGFDSVDEAVRRAIGEASAASAAAEQAGIARQLSSAFGRPLDMQKLAVTGPMACSAGANRPVR
jgi:hypothetical protein